MDVGHVLAEFDCSRPGGLSPLRTLAARLNETPLSPGRPAIFLDRDGVIVKNVTRADGTVGSPRTLEEMEVVESVAILVRRAHEAGYALVVVTNQPDLARGSLDRHTLQIMHENLLQRIPHLDAIYTCPHDSSCGCNCRKPNPGLIKSANDDLRLRASNSWLIGDRSSDVEAGSAARIGSICIPSQIKGVDAPRICKAIVPHIRAESFRDALAIATGLSDFAS